MTIHNAAQASSSNTDNRLWQKLWKVHSHPRCKDLIWLACKNILPVRANLLHRGVQVAPFCPLCGDKAEFVSHALLQCREVAPVWFASPLSIHIPVQDEIDFSTWLFYMISNCDSSTTSTIFEISWALWGRRNDWVHNSRQLL
ncbi:hypothetical protein RIF29_33403 [Crotalaria pallida]|uniref:Reverse transcriptase zinc-binding domain-containing protein n=1 Tax=Crotalaria pallida TaxID=3830 RepID=A0AAN9E893_CROPI